MNKNIFNNLSKLRNNNNRFNKTNKLLIIKTLLRRLLIIKGKLFRTKKSNLLKSSKVKLITKILKKMLILIKHQIS